MMIKAIAHAFPHFLPERRADGYITVFTVEHCCRCGCEIEGPVTFGIDASPAAMTAEGMQARTHLPAERAYVGVSDVSCRECALTAKQQTDKTPL